MSVVSCWGGYDKDKGSKKILGDDNEKQVGKHCFIFKSEIALYVYIEFYIYYQRIFQNDYIFKAPDEILMYTQVWP